MFYIYIYNLNQTSVENVQTSAKDCVLYVLDSNYSSLIYQKESLQRVVSGIGH